MKGEIIKMKSIVKILALVLVVCMFASVALVACGDKTEDPKDSTTTTEATKEATTTLAPPPVDTGDDTGNDDLDADSQFEGKETSTFITGEDAKAYHYGHTIGKIVGIINPGLENWGDGANEQVYDGADGLYYVEDDEGNPIDATKIGGSGSNPQLFLELEEPIKLSGYGLVSGWDSVSFKERHPNKWILYGVDADSLDDIDLDNWKDYESIDVVADGGFTDDNLENSAEYIYEVNASKAYKYYVLDFWGSMPGAFNGFQMNEIYFYAE